MGQKTLKCKDRDKDKLRKLQHRKKEAYKRQEKEEEAPTNTLKHRFPPPFLVLLYHKKLPPTRTLIHANIQAHIQSKRRKDICISCMTVPHVCVCVGVGCVSLLAVSFLVFSHFLF